MSTKVQKVYADGELVYDITGEPVVPPDPPDPLPEGSITFAFAEIPEVVFVSGYADSEDMNIFHLDVLNLYPTATMPWDGGNNFIPRLKCDLVGTLPTGITWNRETGKLIYDGTSVTTNFTGTFNFYNAAADLSSDSFEIKLLKATLVWDYASTGSALHDAVNTAVSENTEAENVILIKSGAHWGTDLRIQSDGYLACFSNRTNMYLIGEPTAIGSPIPILSGTKNDNWVLEYDEVNANYLTRVLVNFEDTLHVHMKNIDVRFGQIRLGGTNELNGRHEYTVLNKVRLRTNPDGVDGIGFGSIYPINEPDPIVHMINFETFHFGGSSGTTHPIYGHMCAEYSNQDPWKEGFLYINNLWSYETRGPSQVTGGIGLKLIENNVSLRNSCIQKVKNNEISRIDYSSGSELISLVSYGKYVMFNNDINSMSNGNSQVLTFANRRLQAALGGPQPPYFSWPALVIGAPNELEKVGFDAWENLEGEDYFNPESTLQTWYALKSQTFHGDNWNENYSATGEQYDETPNPNRAPVAAPFWETIGNPADPLNGDNCYHKYMSHNRFTFYYDTTTTYKGNNLSVEIKAISHRTTAPSVAERQFGPTVKLSAPPNWVERSMLFLCNNSFNDYTFDSRQLVYELSFNNNITTVYPYHPDWTTVMLDRINILGGDIYDGTGDNIPIPVWFKI